MNRNQSLLQKIILISPELLNKWKQMLIDDEQLTETDRKLRNIILNKTMNETDKWYNYHQVLLQNPHKFRYWQNENVQKSIDTHSENIRSIGTQSDNIPIKPIFKRKYSDSEEKEIKPSKLYRSEEILPKVDNPQVMLKEVPSDIKIIKAKTQLEKQANAVIAESILRKKASELVKRGGKLKLQKLKKTTDNRVVGARYHDDIHNESISVDLSTEDELEGEIDSHSVRPERNRKQIGKGVSTRITKLKTYKNKIPWILYREKV